MRRTLITSIAAAAALLAAAGPATAQGNRDRDREEYTSRIDTTVPFSRAGTLELELGTGEIIVSGWNRDQARVRATSERGSLRFDASSSLLTLGLRSGSSRAGDTRFEVTVPMGTRVRASASSGDIRITGTKGDVETRTQSGDISVDDAARAEINAFSGDVEASRIAGDLRVNVLSGDLRISGVSGELEVKTVSGEVDVRDARSRSVRVNSTSGDITYDGIIDPAGRYELQTHSGDIELTMPADVGAQLTVSTYSGGIESDFPLTLQPGDHGVNSSHGKQFTFQLGKGTARISAESFSGDINLRSRGGRSVRDDGSR